MHLPRMKYSDRIRKTTQMRFRGLDHNLGAQDGALFDMSNLCSNHYPLLATRSHRHLYKILDRPGGIYAWEKMCWVDGESFYYDGVEKGRVETGQKIFGSLGAKVVILPDKKYYDIKNDTFGSMESKWEGTSLTFQDGTYVGVAAKANTIQAAGVNWADFFRPGDAVLISGCTKHPKNNKEIVIREIDGEKLGFYEDSFEMDPDGASFTEEGQLSIYRHMPDLIAVCECGNRLWGCDKDTIYSSKQGDPLNWNVFDGLDNDSWAWSPGSVGYFVGCASYKNYPVFFKEDRIHKIYGSAPSDFRSMDSASLGLQETSGASLAVAGENLYYMGRTGMMAYFGGIPAPISRSFGGATYSHAAAGSDGLKYFVSAQGEDKKYRILVYDSQRHTWHKEDFLQITHFTNMDGNLYALTVDGLIWVMGDGKELPEGMEQEQDFAWFAEFSDFTDAEANMKGLTRMQIRLDLESGAFCKVLISYDSGDWEVVKCFDGINEKRTCVVPVVPHRCDHYRLRLEGKGDCKIYSIARDLYKAQN